MIDLKIENMCDKYDKIYPDKKRMSAVFFDSDQDEFDIKEVSYFYPCVHCYETDCAVDFKDSENLDEFMALCNQNDKTYIECLAYMERNEDFDFFSNYKTAESHCVRMNDEILQGKQERSVFGCG